MSVSSTTEIERKYDVQASDVMPDLAQVPGVTTTVAHEHHLDATYYDTASFALSRHRITLRRRVGGADAGWHLKLPATEGARTEVAHPLGDDDESVPEDLLGLVRAVVRLEPLAPVVRLTTTRHETDLVGYEDVVLAKVADDLVTAQRLDRPVPLAQWREWEVELVDGEPGVFVDVAQVLADAGATPADHASKLARALGDDAPSPTQWPSTQKLRGRATAKEAMQAHLGQHVRALIDQDRRVRVDADDSVHKMRVAARRLRSALKTFEPLLQPEGLAEIEADLRWIGAELGVARDAEVLRDHFAALLAQEPPEAIRGPVVEKIAQRQQETYDRGRRDSVEQMDGERYLTLLDRLERLVLEPDITALATERASVVLPRLIARDLRLVTRTHRAAQRATDPVEHDLALHAVRKKAKRLRYAAESAVPVLGARAAKLAARATAVQESLGDHQDSVVARQRLLELAEAAHEAGEDTFTYGRLHAAEERRGADVEREFEASWARLPTTKIGPWLAKR
ncbi:CYTH and CHAD domain-containing protein [Kribbia dieselivorans]|uniref:CYTH and CHAD domain-containing protein n=1 Tax=Kribbia dieselivorans TaxID=331526 RepID=UPI0008399BD3|nr:CYTH and CHAD domain-containing protein [Kribbia dieselivorans]